MPSTSAAKELRDEIRLEKHVARQETRRRLRLRWMVPPKYRGHTEQRRSTWLESFFDLAFASALSVVAISLSGHLNLVGAERYLIVFFPILWCWIGETMYSTRFDTDDLVQRLFVLAEIGAVAGMAIYAPKVFSLSSRVAGFAISYAACRLVLVFKYLGAAYFDPDVRKFTLFYAIGFGIAAILWLVTVWCPVEWIWPIRAVAMTIDVLTPNVMPSFTLKFPPHVSHSPERFGLFTLVLIGELVAAAITASFRVKSDFYQAVYIPLVLWIAFTIWWDYFEASDGASERSFRNKQDLKSFRLWMYIHLPFSASIVALIAVIYSMIGMNTQAPIGNHAAWVLAICCFVLNSCLILIWYSKSNHFLKSPIVSTTLLYWIQAVLFFAIVPLLERVTPMSALGLVGLIALFKVVMEIYHIALPEKLDIA